MKTLVSAVSLTILAVHLSAVPSASLKQGPRPIDAVANGIGRWVPDVAFVTVEGKKGRLSDFKGKKALVVAFTGTSCPLSKRFAPTLAAIEKAYGPKGVAFVFVDPIAVKGAKEDLREMAGEQGFEGPVILDEDESLTRALGRDDYGHLRFGFRPDRPLPRTDRRSVRDRLSTGSTKKTISQGSAGRPPDRQADPIHRLVGSGMRVGRLPGKRSQTTGMDLPQPDLPHFGSQLRGMPPRRRSRTFWIGAL